MNRIACIIALALSTSALAQQTVPFAEGVPVAPTGLTGKPLADGPFLYPTAEQQNVRVSVLTRGLEYPYSLAFLPGGDLLVTERRGQLRILRGGVLDPKPVPGGPASRFKGKSGQLGAMHGYMALAVHPRFADNGWVYFSYSKPAGAEDAVTAVVRARFDGKALHDVQDVFTGEAHYGAVAIAMTPDAMLWIATSGDDAQDPKTFGGKVLRLKDDGSVPKDNPFVGKGGWRAEIYTFGHRSSLGLTVYPGSNDVWLSEMGPNGGDEINILRAGRNYGWPLVSLGRSYTGEWHAEGGQPTHEGYEYPYVYWMPAISVSGLTFYTGDRLPRWKGDLFVGGLRMGEIPGTGHLERVLFNEKLEELRRESLLVDLRQRIRDVKQGPDGLLYVATDEEKGAILRIEPVE
ncbi:MAG TPA: PQQ-dependent sugar dehydrogenase [Gammaproteobacteria bacterium]